MHMLCMALVLWLTDRREEYIDNWLSHISVVLMWTGIGHSGVLVFIADQVHTVH